MIYISPLSIYSKGLFNEKSEPCNFTIDRNITQGQSDLPMILPCLESGSLIVLKWFQLRQFLEI